MRRITLCTHSPSLRIQNAVGRKVDLFMTKRVQKLLFNSVCPLVFSLSSLVCHGAEKETAGPSINDAFASVQREGKPYKTFYNNYIAPHAVLEKGIVFTAHQDGQGRPIVDAYDISKHSWTGPVRASDSGLGEDTHGNPSITIDAKGHVHIFFGCHRKAMKHVRSAAPYDITQWEDMPSPTPRATYSQSMRMADGSMYLFYRAADIKSPGRCG